MKRYSVALFCMSLCVAPMQAARIDEAVYGGIRKSFFCLAAVFSVTKTLAHSKMAQYTFIIDSNSGKQPERFNDRNLHDCWWRSWGVWGGMPLKENMSYVQHGASSTVWLTIACGCLYGLLCT